MATATPEPRTFVEMVLALLEDRFPWLGKERPCTWLGHRRHVDRLCTTALRKARRAARRKRRPRQ
jgi:hypothetical protein